MFVSSEFLASLWENFRGRGTLNHTRYTVILSNLRRGEK